MVTSTSNPLSAYMRQPKIYIRLPSNGQFWPEGSLEKTDTGEYPVYSMTAQDEMLLKIPDALMNGQAVVDVIQHCMPNIKNAWECPNIDIDVILVAIRLATYGNKLVSSINLGPDNEGDDIEFEYTTDLTSLLDSLMHDVAWEPHIQVTDDVTVFVKPINYRQITKIAIQSFETQKIMQIANDDNISETDKVSLFKESFSKLTEVTVSMVANSIYKIDTPGGSTEDSQFIAEFINNTDKEIFNIIQTHIENMREQNTIRPVVIDTPQEFKDRGYAADKIEIPLTFDPTNFFA